MSNNFSLGRRRPGLTHFPINKPVMDNPPSLVPLLEEVGDPSFTTLLVDVSYPAGAHLPMLTDACLFAPSDDPLERAV
ncbi:MAG: hypothetical protein WKF77_19380 [Planctomycetaceae bacterium]